MIFLEYEVKRKSAPTELQDRIGAYALCWINIDDIEFARKELEEIIGNEGWFIIEELRHAFPNKEDYSSNHEGLGYFLEALEHGVSVVFHSWPASDMDGQIEN